MAVTYNHTLFDLNNRRQYPLGIPDSNFPSEVISDLKLSVPNIDSEIIINSIYAADNCLRIVFSADNRLIAAYSSNNRNLLKIGTAYALKEITAGYKGFIVLGEGIKKDWNYAGSSKVSEECITRYRPSAVPYAGLVCNYNKITTGEAYIAGTELQLTTDVIALPNNLLPQCDTALSFQLIDNQSVSSQNPMIAMANGINSFVVTPDKESPIFTIANVRPDINGVIRIHFEDHFKLTSVVNYIDDPVMTDAGIPLVYSIAVAVDVNSDAICGAKKDLFGEAEDTDPNAPTPALCDLNDIKFIQQNKST
ncbi:MAG: hypothetical protein LBJ00_06020 [Planctomycetaceae bacterium]|jgi:hypothetical protein|nr:hypothetical protein [Planctomycetaceae bacterium]